MQRSNRMTELRETKKENLKAKQSKCHRERQLLYLLILLLVTGVQREIGSKQAAI